MSEHIEIQERMERIRAALEDGSSDAVVDTLIAGLHPADLAEIIDALDADKRVGFFRRIPPDRRAETLTEVVEGAWPSLLDSVEEQDVHELFEGLELDDAADILAELPSDEARQILDRIEPEESREIAALMRYDEESAGGVMTTELVSVPAHLTADEAIVAVRRRGREVNDFYTVYVVDDEDRLVGTIGLQDLITLGTSGLGALVVAQFEGTIQRLAFVVVFMPVVAAMAGNSAIQATTVAVRRLALTGRPARLARSLSREIVAGFVIGGIIALLLGIAAGIWQGSVRIALVAGGSMWLATALGATWGAAFPLLLDRLGLDPAVSSSVFLTTMTDMLSFLLILGSATYFLLQWL